MMKILAIGNSFTEDATYYLHQISEAAGVENMVVNLYIGSCSLEKHWSNIETGKQDYQYQVNGVMTRRKVSIREMLDENEWDAIVTQQVSGDSGWQDSYEPFLGLILEYMQVHAPKAKIFLNESWAYDKDSGHMSFGRYHKNQLEMFERVHAAYTTMAEKYELPLIPSGELIQKLRETEYFADGKRSICRDGFHMSFIYGRYAVACMWAKWIFGISLKDNVYIPRTENLLGVEPDMEIVDMIKSMVDDM